MVAPQWTHCWRGQGKGERGNERIYRISATGMGRKTWITAFLHIHNWLPFFQEMAGRGAPETSQVSTAVIPSVTVVSSGGWIKAGLMSTIKNSNSVAHLSERSFNYYCGLLYIHFYRADHGEGHDNKTWKPFSSDCNLFLFISQELPNPVYYLHRK